MRSDSALLNGLEQATRRGAAPAILNDDNGHWACIDEGVQSIIAVASKRAVDTQFMFWVPSEHWHDTLRKAIDAYLDEIIA